MRPRKEERANYKNLYYHFDLINGLYLAVNTLHHGLVMSLMLPLSVSLRLGALEYLDKLLGTDIV